MARWLEFADKRRGGWNLRIKGNQGEFLGGKSLVWGFVYNKKGIISDVFIVFIDRIVLEW